MSSKLSILETLEHRIQFAVPGVPFSLGISGYPVDLDVGTPDTVAFLYYDATTEPQTLTAAVWSISQEKLLGSTPVIGTGKQGSDSSIAAANDGTFVVVWDDGRGISGRRFDAHAQPLTATFDVSRGPRAPRIAMDDDGDFAVVYDTGGRPEVARFAADTTRKDSGLPLHDGTDTFSNPSIDMDADGDFVVAWRDQRFKTVKVTIHSDGETYTDYRDVLQHSTLFAKRFDSNGNLTASITRRFAGKGHYEDFHTPIVQVENDGDFTIALSQTFNRDYVIRGPDSYEAGTELFRHKITLEKYSATGKRIENISTPFSNPDAFESEKPISINASGVVTLAWRIDKGATFSQSFNASGSPFGAAASYSGVGELRLASLPSGDTFALTADLATNETKAILLSAPRVDLAAGPLTISGSAAVVAGERATGATLKLTNSGQLPISGQEMKVRLYVSADSTLDPSEQFAEIPLTVSLAVGKQTTLKLPFANYPNVSDGNYRFYAVLEGGDEDTSNNTSTSTDVTFTSAHVDYSLSSSGLIVSKGRKPTVTARFGVTNIGTMAGSGNATFTLTATSPTGAVTSKVFTLPFKLKPGASKNLSLKLPFSSALESGAYSLIIDLTSLGLPASTPEHKVGVRQLSVSFTA